MKTLQPYRLALKVSAWPHLHRLAWQTAITPANLFDVGPRPTDRWGDRTLREIENSYGRWLRWVEHKDGLDASSSPGDQATKPLVATYYEQLTILGLAGHTVATELVDLARALSAMCPHKDWKWISRAGHRVQARALSTPKPFRSPTETLGLGMSLMDAAQKDEFRSSLERAVLFRDGLIIAFLSHRPVRLANLSVIQIGRHLVGDGNAYAITFAPSETKTEREINFLWPEELLAALARYREHFRLRLLLAGKGVRRVGHSDALWISRRGAPFDKAAIGAMIALRTKAAFGERLSPHTFRHIAATTIATEAPENVTDAARILGHAALATTEKYYNQARTLDAYKRFQAALGRR